MYLVLLATADLVVSKAKIVFFSLILNLYSILQGSVFKNEVFMAENGAQASHRMYEKG